jgi:hypothetical protein
MLRPTRSFRARPAGPTGLDGPQVGQVGSGAPELAEHHGRRPDSLQPLASHVADQQPDGTGALDRLVEVAPDERLGSRAEVLGGVVLILIGLRILLDHLGVI